MTTIIHTGDALTVLRTLPAESIDCCITDPPYQETGCGWDKRTIGWLLEVKRLLRPCGSVWFFTSLRHLLAITPELSGWVIAQDLVWEKQNGTCSRADRFRRVHEYLVHLYPLGRPWGGVYHEPQYTNDAKSKSVRRQNQPTHWGKIGTATYRSIAGGKRLMRSVLHVSNCHRRAIHPTQKPEKMVEPLVLYSCPPGGVVLDPFAGSGTTGVVAQLHRRNFIGIERDAAMADRARKRIAAADPIGHQESIDGVA